jgi:hypothetical protein
MLPFSIDFVGRCIVVADRFIDLDGYEKSALQQTYTSINHTDGVYAETVECHLDPRKEDGGINSKSLVISQNIVTLEVLQPTSELA